MNKEEILDLTDEQDRIIGQIKREEAYAKKVYNFRAVCGMIRNQEGKLWIPKRTAEKKLCPLGLDMSVAGHVESGESYMEAFEREMWEELRLKREEIKVKEKGKLSPYVHGTKGWIMVYEIKTEKEPNYNKQDFMSAGWYEAGEIKAAHEKGIKMKSGLIKVIENFYLAE